MVLSFEVFPLKPDAPIDTIPIGLQRISHSLWTQYFRIPQMMYLSYKFLFNDNDRCKYYLFGNYLSKKCVLADTMIRDTMNSWLVMHIQNIIQGKDNE